MQRGVPSLVVVAVALILLADYLVANPVLSDAVGVLTEYLVLLAAAAAVAGVLALGRRHIAGLMRRRGETVGSVLVLSGMFAMLLLGLLPGSAGGEEPAVRWLVTSLLIPLVAAIFALLPLVALRVARRGTMLHSREAAVMLLAAGVMVVLLLPLAGAPGDWLAGSAAVVLDGPLAAIFRGLLIATALATAISAARLLFGIGGADD